MKIKILMPNTVGVVGICLPILETLLAKFRSNVWLQKPDGSESFTSHMADKANTDELYLCRCFIQNCLFIQ